MRGSLARRVFVMAAGVVALTALIAGSAPQSASRYFPPKGKWETREPAALGFDKAKLDEAVAYAIANENPNTKDLAADIVQTFGLVLVGQHPDQTVERLLLDPAPLPPLDACHPGAEIVGELPLGHAQPLAGAACLVARQKAFVATIGVSQCPVVLGRALTRQFT
jgi:hypothetical protein